MEASVTCPECGATTAAAVASVGHSEYVGCPDCGHRFLWEPVGDAPDEAAAAVPEPDDELDWGGGAGGDDFIALYPATSRLQIAGLLLLLAALGLLTNVILLNGTLGDPGKVEGATVKMNEIMVESGMSSSEDYDEEFVRSVLRAAIVWELLCTVLVAAGGVLVLLRQNYTLVLAGCAAALVGMGPFMLATLFGAIALYLVLQSRPEFGIIEEESW